MTVFLLLQYVQPNLTVLLLSIIWNVCNDVLRGLFKPHEYGDIILPFTVLRRLDCVLEPHKDTVIDLYNEYKSQVDFYLTSQ
jgi:type I restriction enzyme M protein